jgi:hypothetical protein
MPTKGELMNLGEALAVTLGKLRKAGVRVKVWDSVPQFSNIQIHPLTHCPTCRRLSPAEECLWCEEETK